MFQRHQSLSWHFWLSGHGLCIVPRGWVKSSRVHLLYKECIVVLTRGPKTVTFAKSAHLWEQDRRVSDCVWLFTHCCPNLLKRRTELDSQAFSTSWSPIEHQIGKLSWTQDVDKNFKLTGKNLRARAYTEHANRYLFYVLCTTLGERGLLRRSGKGKKRTCLRRLTISTAWTPGRSYLTPACTCDRGTLRLFIEPATWLLGVHKGI